MTSKRTAATTDATTAALIEALKAQGWMTATDAAMRANVPKNTIGTWAQRRRLKQHVVDGIGFVRLADVRALAKLAPKAAVRKPAPDATAESGRQGFGGWDELAAMMRQAVRDVLQERGL